MSLYDSGHMALGDATLSGQSIIARIRGLRRSDTLLFAPGKLIPAALTVIATPVFARVLGPSAYGVLAVATTLTLLATAVFFGWAEIVAVRELVEPGSSVEDLCAQASLIFLGAATLAIAATGAAFLLKVDFLLIGAVSVAVLAWGSATFAIGALRGRRDPRGYTRTAILGSGGRAVVGVPAALLGAGPAGVIGGWAVGAIVAVCLATKRLNVKLRNLRITKPRHDFLAYAAPAIAVTSSFLILSIADRALLAAFKPSTDVGTYSLGYSLVEQSLVLGFSILQASGFPRLLGIFSQHGSHLASQALGHAITRVLTLTTIVALPLALFGTHVMVVIGGPQYRTTDAPFLPLIVVGVMLLGVAQYLSIPMQHARDSRTWALAVGTCAVMNIVANLVLIPPFGLVGAGIATALAYALFLAISSYIVLRSGISVLPSIRFGPWATATLAGGIVGVIALALGTWTAGLVLAPATYGTVCLLMARHVQM